MLRRIASTRRRIDKDRAASRSSSAYARWAIPSARSGLFTSAASLPGDAERIARAVRAHREGGNRLHGGLDVPFHEDPSRVRSGHAANKLASVRHILAVSCFSLFISLTSHPAALPRSFLSPPRLREGGTNRPTGPDRTSRNYSLWLAKRTCKGVVPCEAKRRRVDFECGNPAFAFHASISFPQIRFP